jgi:hypothetical protein
LKSQDRNSFKSTKNNNRRLAVFLCLETNSFMKTATKPKSAPKAAPAPASAGIKKINLGGIAIKKDKQSTAYPALPDPSGDAAMLTSDILSESREMEALGASLNAKKSELRALAQGFYFEHFHGKHDILSSVEATGMNPEEKVLVTFTSKYSAMTDETPLIEAIGPDRTAQFFRQSFELKIDGDKIPADSAEDLIEAIQALFAKYNCNEALTAKAVIKPTPDFHEARHIALSVEENRAVDLACPIGVQIKTKGRK